MIKRANPNPNSSRARWRARRGFSLVELMMVVAIVGILAYAAVPLFTTSHRDNLKMAARVITSDLSYARSLAISNNSSYKFTFDSNNNQYTLEHDGTNTSLDNLPSFAFDANSDNAAKQVTDLSDLPQLGQAVSFVGATHVAMMSTDQFSWTTASRVDTLTFTSLGSTQHTDATVLWIKSGQGDEKLFLPILVNPTTGMAVVGDFYSESEFHDATSFIFQSTMDESMYDESTMYYESTTDDSSGGSMSTTDTYDSMGSWSDDSTGGTEESITDGYDSGTPSGDSTGLDTTPERSMSPY